MKLADKVLAEIECNQFLESVKPPLNLDTWVKTLSSSMKSYGTDMAGELELQGMSVSDADINHDALVYAIEDLSKKDKNFAKFIKDKKNLSALKKQILK